MAEAVRLSELQVAPAPAGGAAVRRMGIATAYVPGSKYHVFWALVLTE
jgi:hypothetical protein